MALQGKEDFHVDLYASLPAYLAIAARSRLGNRGFNFSNVRLNFRPTRCRQNEDSDSPALEILLISQVLVRGKQKVETAFRYLQEVTVC